MSTARTGAVALIGVVGHLVEVEVDLGQGLPVVTVVGMADQALREARERVRPAITNSGFSFPSRRVTVSLSPAALPKAGSGFDLPLAVALLAVGGVVPAATAAQLVCVGELGLEGQVRPVRGVLPAVLAAVRSGRPRVVVASANAEEAGLVPGAEVVAVGTVRELVARLRGEPWHAGEGPPAPSPPAAAAPSHLRARTEVDLADVLGQPDGRRAVEIAAAGGHHLCLLGPPGTGKTMLAERLPGVLPPLADDEALEVTCIHSVAGVLPPGAPLVRTPPFCDLHHTATVPALVGGGHGLARPGAASLAHRGVLFLDEAAEFAAGVLDALRQPLESGEVSVGRVGGTTRFPARFRLVLAANPCPCAPPSGRDADCRCPAAARKRYLARLSGPLLDRVDLTLRLRAVSPAEMTADATMAESSAVVAARVAAARQAAAHRYAGLPWRSNAEVPAELLRRQWRLPPATTRPLSLAMDRGRISARGFDRVLRVAWTLADLAGAGRPTVGDVHEALALRGVA